MACCYEKGDWWDITGCNENGKKTQQQTTVNCIDSKKTRDVDCEYVGEWRKTGECAAGSTDRYSATLKGKQWYSRTTVNSNKSTSESKDCKVQQQVKSCYGGGRGNPTPYTCNLVWRDKPNPNKCTSRPGGGCNYPPTCYATGESRIEDRTLCPEKTLCKNSEGTWVDC